MVRLPPMVSARVLVTTLVLTACAPAPPPAPATPAVPVAETPPPPATVEAPTPPPPLAPEPPLDPSAVRCGVDDSPVEIGLRRHEPDLRAAEAPVERAAFGISVASSRVRDFNGFSPILRGPSNAPLDPGVTLFTIADVRRDGRALAEADFPPGLLVKPVARPRERALPCGLSPAQDRQTLKLEVRVAANGQPVSAVARAKGLTDVQSRCLGEMACKLAVPPETKASTLAVEGTIAFTAPVLAGTATAGTRRASRAGGAVDPAFGQLDRVLTKIAKACAQKTPPVSTFAAEITLKPSGKGQLSPGSFPTGESAGAILGCVADRLGEAPKVSMATLREDLVTTVTVTVAR